MPTQDLSNSHCLTGLALLAEETVLYHAVQCTVASKVTPAPLPEGTGHPLHRLVGLDGTANSCSRGNRARQACRPRFAKEASDFGCSILKRLDSQEKLSTL